MPLNSFIEKVENYLNSSPVKDNYQETNVPGLALVRHYLTSEINCMIYQPLLCLVLQGQKETMMGNKTIRFGNGDSIIVSHDVPIVSQVTEASKERPYLALVFELDFGIVRSLYEDVTESDLQQSQGKAIQSGQTQTLLLDALERLFDLNDRPQELSVMLPLIQREIHYRMLCSAQGQMLRSIQQRGSHADRISKVINQLRQDIAKRFSGEELAQIAGMSISSFHDHFKNITAMTPLQYQKDLRLIEARRLLIDKNQPVSSVAFDIGYESATQFSREYSRKFGIAPSKDKAALI